MKTRANIFRVFVCSLLMLSITIGFAACGGKEEKNGIPVFKDIPIEYENKFGGVYIKLTIDDFNAAGFAIGDSVNIVFFNGFELKDLPYYNGYYVDMGEPLLVGYAGYPFIRAGYNNGEDMYIKAGLTDKDTATIKLEEKAKYLDVQQSLDIYYSDVQGDTSNEMFANFRAVNVGNLKQNILYRSASPADNQHMRAAVADRLAAKAGIGFIINLSDDEDELIEHIEADDFNSPYFLSLYNQNKVIVLSMSMSYETENFSHKLVKGLTAASKVEGPFLVHCVEGKDRTGFVCMILEALAGASYQEMIDDYMVTYDNYYGINIISEPVKYNIIKEKYIDDMLDYISGFGQEDKETSDYALCVRNYLISIGMKEADVDALTARLV